ncbi:hypothetical protein ACFR97_10255 [Haloplanus litoreus]|uniref:Uncharacterized protein n=1 Tax=Haloplanus litoreus TaxID=767515 RepID=A0ABD6A3F4_9EURY
MATLESSFEAKLRKAMLDEAEHALVGRQANLVFEFVELVHTRLRAYGERHGYDVESTIDSLGEPQVERRRDRLVVAIGWESEQMARWEFGTSDHHVDGDPVLSFVWSGPDVPQWVRKEFDQARDPSGQFRSGWRVFLPDVDVSGLPESRAIRDAFNGLRRLLEI